MENRLDCGTFRMSRECRMSQKGGGAAVVNVKSPEVAWFHKEFHERTL